MAAAAVMQPLPADGLAARQMHAALRALDHRFGLVPGASAARRLGLAPRWLGRLPRGRAVAQPPENAQHDREQKQDSCHKAEDQVRRCRMTSSTNRLPTYASSRMP